VLADTAQQVLPILRRSQSAQESTASGADEKRALAVLKNDTSFASSLLVAVRILFGNQCLAWEPESFWVACETDHDLDVPTLNRVKLMAVSTLVQTPRFYADANVFEKTCVAFNDVVPIPEAINEATPAQMAWGVLEATLVTQSEGIDPDFDYEPRKYAGVSMARDGLLLAPGLLVFAQEELNSQLRSPVEDTMRAIHNTWERISKDTEDLRDYEYGDNPVDVQLAKLASIELYVHDRAARYRTELSELL
jgi:hypothetical protein